LVVELEILPACQGGLDRSAFGRDRDAIPAVNRVGWPSARLAVESNQVLRVVRRLTGWHSLLQGPLPVIIQGQVLDDEVERLGRGLSRSGHAAV
jgi:hypothetical protein